MDAPYFNILHEQSRLCNHICIFNSNYPADVWMLGGQQIKTGTIGVIVSARECSNFSPAIEIINTYSREEIIRGVRPDGKIIEYEKLHKLCRYDLTVYWFPKKEDFFYVFSNEYGVYSCDGIRALEDTQEWLVNHAQITRVSDLSYTEAENLGLTGPELDFLHKLDSCATFIS